MAFPHTVSARLTRSRLGLAASVALLAFTAPGCEKIALLAPSGSAITLDAIKEAICTDEVTISAFVTESKSITPPANPPQGGNNNATPTAGGGTPVHNGTEVTFTTDIGEIQPAEARTVNGRVTVTFVGNGVVGTAKIIARSGPVTATHELKLNPVPTGGGQQ
jgi:hypothetical protein